MNPASLRTRLRLIEKRLKPQITALWIYCGYPNTEAITDAGGGVWRIGLETYPAEIPEGSLILLRDEERPEAALKKEYADMALAMMDLSPQQRDLTRRSPKIVLLTAKDPNEPHRFSPECS